MLNLKVDVFQQVDCIAVWTSYASLLTDLFPYHMSFFKSLSKYKKIEDARKYIPHSVNNNILLLPLYRAIDAFLLVTIKSFVNGFYLCFQQNYKFKEEQTMFPDPFVRLIHWILYKQVPECVFEILKFPLLLAIYQLHLDTG